jgi:hypothetical protein
MIMNNETLDILKGKVVLNVDTEITMAVPYSVSSEDEITIKTPLKISVEDHILFIYNRWNFRSANGNDLQNVKGHKIIDIEYRADSLLLIFSNDTSVEVDLTSNGYMGSESLVLYGQDAQMMVWN